jgi:hypothetical protein
MCAVDDQFAGVDDLLDLVLALLVVDGLGHQPVALIHDQRVVVALRGGHGGPVVFEPVEILEE